MSLTSELRSGKHLRTLFKAAFDPMPLLKEIRERCAQSDQIFNPKIDPKDFSLIGTAIDYRLRYYFQPTPVHELVAYQAVLADRSYIRRIEGAFGPAFVENTLMFFADLILFIRQTAPAGRGLSKQKEAELCRYCLVLAKLDQLFRAFPQVAFGGSEKSMLAYDALSYFKFQSMDRLRKELFACFPGLIVDDMAQLSRKFFERQRIWLNEKRIILNPGFILSSRVGGADGDIIVGNTYFDIKAGHNPLKGLDLYQIFAYPLLDPLNDLKIKRTGIYLARYGIELSWSHKELFKLMAKPGIEYQAFWMSFAKATEKVSAEYQKLENLRRSLGLRNG
jgi:hypothetical protein